MKKAIYVNANASTAQKVAIQLAEMGNNDSIFEKERWRTS
jgi:hypothetical protein